MDILYVKIAFCKKDYILKMSVLSYSTNCRIFPGKYQDGISHRSIYNGRNMDTIHYPTFDLHYRLFLYTLSNRRSLLNESEFSPGNTARLMYELHASVLRVEAISNSVIIEESVKLKLVKILKNM